MNNYMLNHLPFSGDYVCVEMTLQANQSEIGTIRIRLTRSAFPAGVENFVHLIKGSSCYANARKKVFTSEIIHRAKSYQNCSFHLVVGSHYMTSGDIYKHDGSASATIYNDEPFPGPATFERELDHMRKGSVSLFPFVYNDIYYYDSTFMITLDDAKPTNGLANLDQMNIVIGQVYEGLEVLDKINEIYRPQAGVRRPRLYISSCRVIPC